MCGRFVSASPPDQIAAYFGATLSESLLAPSYNVAPTNDIYAVIETPEGERASRRSTGASCRCGPRTSRPA